MRESKIGKRWNAACARNAGGLSSDERLRAMEADGQAAFVNEGQG